MINLFFIIYSIICLAPIALTLGISLSSEESVILNGFNFIPKELSLDAYRFLLADIGRIGKAYGVSIFVTVVGTLLSVGFTVLFAYPISRKDFPGAKAFTFFIFFTMLFNGGLVASYLINTQIFNFSNHIRALIVPIMMNPFNVLVVRTFFIQSVPKDIVDSAKIDGASEYRIFGQIVLPLAKPAIATIALFDTLFYWNDWFNSLLYIRERDLFTLQYTMYSALMDVKYILQFAQNSSDVMSGMSNMPVQTIRFSMVLIAIGPIVLAYPYFQKYFVKGLTIGAIKG